MTIEKLFFQLLQIAIGTRNALTVKPTSEEWALLFEMAKKQALVAIAFNGVTRLNVASDYGASLGIPEMVYLKWLGLVAKTAQRNRETLAVCRRLADEYRADGFDSCVMKGQSNRLYYPSELAVCRTSGDVDVWMRPMNGSRNPVAEVMRYFERKDDIVSLCYLHIENHPVDGVPVEVHFRPSFFNSPLRNRRFLRWMKWEDCVERSEELGFNVLKTEYNLVFQLNHLYRHLLDEGVGLRQVLDYWTLLTSHKGRNDVSGKEKFAQKGPLLCKNEVVKTIEGLGMKRFASALMWVLQEVFAMPSEYMLCEPSEKEGRFLLDEIMRSGNFGHYDPRMQKLEGDSHSLRNQLHRVWLRMRRNLRFITSYPSEVIWEPIARAEHFLWRKLELWRY